MGLLPHRVGEIPQTKPRQYKHPNRPALRGVPRLAAHKSSAPYWSAQPEPRGMGI